MRKLLFLLFLFGFTNVAFPAPSNTISTTSVTAGTNIASATENSNNNAISAAYNSHTHTDLTQVGAVTVGTWAATPVNSQFGGTGSNLANAVQGGIAYFYTTGAMTASTPGNSGQVFISNGASNNPNWGSVLLASMVSGTLGITNGGTGVTTNTWSLGAISTYGSTTSGPAGTITNPNLKIYFGQQSLAANTTRTISGLGFSTINSYIVMTTLENNDSANLLSGEASRVDGASFTLTNQNDTAQVIMWLTIGN